MRDQARLAKAKRETSDLELMNVPPVYKEDGPEWAGQVLWVTRGTRPEALFAARRLSTRLTVWTALEDADALYMWAFFEKYPSLGIIFEVYDSDDLHHKGFQESWADSDLAGEEVSARSTSGWGILARGQRSRAFLDVGVRRQSVTGFSSPDSELRAQADMVVRSAAVVQTVLRAIFGRDVFERLRTDHAAALSAIRAGHSRKMAYMRRTQKISIGLIADYCAAVNTEISACKSGENLSDLLTKALDSNVFWRLARLLGVG